MAAPETETNMGLKLQDDTQGEAMIEPSILSAPFPWFGGKSRVSSLIWERFGNPKNFVDPFFGSGAVLLRRPYFDPGQHIETVNDADGLLVNAWRALQVAPDQVAAVADAPSFECDLHAWHSHLKAQRVDLVARLEGDPNYCDALLAGKWLWGIAQWIGSGWCSETSGGPWVVQDGKLVLAEHDAAGTNRQMLHLGNAGRGVSRQMLHLGNAGRGQGVTCQQGAALLDWFLALQQRLCRVRVCCGDWQRVMGPAVTFGHGITAIMLDPPYSTEENRTMNMYAKDSGTVAHDVRAWCLANGDNPLLRIALCGYGDAHDALLKHGWTKAAWKPHGGYGSQGTGRGRENSIREMIWFNRSCLDPQQGSLFSTPS